MGWREGIKSRFLSSVETTILFCTECWISGSISGGEARLALGALHTDPMLSQCVHAGVQTVQDADANLDYLAMHGMLHFHFQPPTNTPPALSLFYSTLLFFFFAFFDSTAWDILNHKPQSAVIVLLAKKKGGREGEKNPPTY